MLRKMTLLLCIPALCAAGFSYPIGVVVRTHAATVAKSNDPIKDLHQATAHAQMNGSLRGDLLPILNSARQNFRAGNLEAAADLLAYIALLEAQSGQGIAPGVADELIAAANAIVASILSFQFAGDYDRVPITVVAPTGLTEKDWRNNGVVSGVGNQGMCSADYAFSATGASESAQAIKTGTLKNLSEQQLVDCDAANNGCQGGSPVRALEYAIANVLRAHASELSYPYTAQEGTCKNAVLGEVRIDALERPQPGDEEALKSFVAAKGPVSVVLRITSSAWDSYTGGIFDPAAGTPVLQRNVAALVVGFNEQAGTPCWIVKAAYGTGWGDQGYAFVRRGQNALGIADFVVHPIPH